MRRGTVVFWSVFIAAAIIRVAFSFGGDRPDASTCLKQTVNGIGTVTEDPARKSTGQVFVVHASRLRVVSTTTGMSSSACAEGLSIRMKTKLYPRFSYGDRVSFTGKLSEPFNFSSDSGRTFDYRGFLAKDGVFYEIKSASTALATSTDGLEDRGPDVSRVTAILLKIKRKFVSNLEDALGEPHAALAAGLVVGEKAALGADLLEDFRVVGLIHIVVLSGFNITIVGVAMRRMLSSLPRIWGIVIGGIGIALFGIMVGGGATVVRSCFMAGVALIADLIRRDYSVHRALGFAALIMLIQNPLILLHDPSFQLSFLATLGLILLSSPIESKLGWITEKLGMRGTVASCLATQIFVSPFILHMMGQISVIGTIVNILVLPAIPLTMLFVFLTGAIGFVSQVLAGFVGWGTHLLLSYELFMVEKFAGVPLAAIGVPKFSGWFVSAFYVLFAAVYMLRRRKARIPFRIPEGNPLLVAYKELDKIATGIYIPEPDLLIFVGVIPGPVSVKIGLPKNTEVYISRRALKHMIERRGPKSLVMIDAIPKAVIAPAKIVDNSRKRKDSFLFFHRNDIVVCVVVEKTKTTQRCQVVSAFPIHPKIYKKMIDISGGAESPPFELPS